MSSDPWVTAQRQADEAKRRARQARDEIRFAPVARYNAALQNALVVLRDASPLPGQMTARQERAQIELVNAFLDLPEKRT